MSNQSPMSVTGNTPKIFVFEMAPDQDTLPPDDPDYMEGWFWNFDDGNADTVFGPFASEEAARADAKQTCDERVAAMDDPELVEIDPELVEIAQAIYAAMRGTTEIKLGHLCWAIRDSRKSSSVPGTAIR